MNEVDICWARLQREEGDKLFAYNDKTGKRVTCRPEGNLTIAIGVNLEEGLDEEESEYLSKRRLLRTAAALSKFSWYGRASCTINRKSIFLDVGFNAGVNGLLHFPHMLSAADKEDWETATNELLNSDAARKDPNRYKPLATILKSG